MLALGALAAAVLGGRLGAGDLVGDPVIYAALAKAAVRRGEWATQWLAGRPFFDKPPLVVWLTALSFRLFGVATWSARLPSVACAVGCCLATTTLGARIGGRRVGLAAGAVLALTPGFIRFGSTLFLDAPFVLCALLGFHATLDAWARDGRGLWRAGAWFGLAFMAKGAQTLVVPAILVGTWVVGGAERPPFRALVAAGAAFVAVTLPWHAWELWRWGGAFVAGTVSDVTEKLGDAPALAVYVRAVAETTLPWLPLALTGVWRTARGGLRTPALRLLAVWTALAYGVLLAAGKQSPRYLMLVHPALAIWTALAVAPWLPATPRLARAVGAAAAVAWVAMLAWPRALHPTGVRDAVVALAPALGPSPDPVQGFRLRHEGTRARFYYYLDRDVRSSDQPDVLAELPPGTPIVAAARYAPELAADGRFAEAKRSRDFVVFRPVGMAPPDAIPQGASLR